MYSIRRCCKSHHKIIVIYEKQFLSKISPFFSLLFHASGYRL